MSKLKTIWALIKSEHYLLITPSGTHACYLKNGNSHIIKDWAELLAKKQKENEQEKNDKT